MLWKFSLSLSFPKLQLLTCGTVLAAGVFRCGQRGWWFRGWYL